MSENFSQGFYVCDACLGRTGRTPSELADDREAICGSLGLHPETELSELLATISAVRSEARNYPALQLRIGDLAEQVRQLESWKSEQLAVESEWDAQAVGRLLGVPLGQSIRAAIQPGIERLRAAVQDALATGEREMQPILDNGRLRDVLRSALAATAPPEGTPSPVVPTPHRRRTAATATQDGGNAMTNEELRAYSEWILRPSFYVEARVGSQNHRGECCRALMDDARYNERADELLKEFARHFLASEPAEWREQAAAWLLSMAVEQERNNERFPAHAAAYQSWRDRPMLLRMLAQDVMQHGLGIAAKEKS